MDFIFELCKIMYNESRYEAIRQILKISKFKNLIIHFEQITLAKTVVNKKKKSTLSYDDL